MGPGFSAKDPKCLPLAGVHIVPIMSDTRFYYRREPQLPLPFPGEPARPAGRSGPGFCGVTGLSRFSGAHGILCVPFKSTVSVCPSTRGLLTFRGKCSGSSYSQFQTPRLRRVTWGSELSFLWGNHCNVIVFQPGGTSGKKICLSVQET